MDKKYLKLFLALICLMTFGFVFPNSQVFASQIPSYYCLRDEYVINTKNQTDFNNCWSFATLTSLETCLAVNTGEYYDFSEAFLTLQQKIASPYSVVGSLGGDMSTALTYIKNDGLVLECDFSYDKLFYANDNNYLQMFEFYNSFANKDIANNFNLITFYYNQKDEIKRHIIENGSVNLNMYGITYKTNSQNGTTYATTGTASGGHAVSIIGWDDNYTLTVGEQVYKGAFIVLDSLGSTRHKDGIFYYLYDYVPNNNKLYGVEYVGEKVECLNTSNYQIPIVNKYSSQTNFTAQNGQCKNVNVFYDNSLFYKIQLQNVQDDKNLSVLFYQNGTKVDNFSYELNGGILFISAIAPSGVYKIEIKTETQTIVKQVYYISDFEFEYSAFLQNNKYFYSNFNINSAEQNLFVKKTQNQTTMFVLVTTPYFKATNFDCNGARVDLLDISQHKLYIVFEPNNECGEYCLTLKNNQKIAKYCLILGKNEQILTNLFIFDEFDGNYSKQIFIGQNESYMLSKPYRTDKTFVGFCLDINNNVYLQENTDNTFSFNYLNLSNNTTENYYTKKNLGLDDYKRATFLFSEFRDLPKIDCEILSYSGQYDGQEHSVYVNNYNNIENLQVEYSTDNINFSLILPKFKTVISQIVYIKLSANGFATETKTANVNIVPRQIQVDLEQKEFVYNGKNITLIPKFTNGIDESISYNINAYYIFAGEYTLDITVDKNYKITNSVDFVIKKAIPNCQLRLSVNVDTIPTNLYDISLPEGYVWNDNQIYSKNIDTYYCKFVPKNTENYECVENIQVKIIFNNENNENEKNEITDNSNIGTFAFAFGTPIILTSVFAILYCRKKKY